MNAPVTVPRVPLGDLIDILSGFAFKSERFGDGGEIPVIRIRDVKRGYSETFYSGEYDDRYLINDGDLLIGMDGEFNRERWKGGKALLNQRVCKISTNDRHLSSGYLYHFLPNALLEIEDRTPFATVKHLSSKDIREVEIPLPPLDEQRRIAAILDKADALRRKRKRAIELLDSLVQSIFTKMFGREKNHLELAKICSKITDGTHQAPKWADFGVPFLFVSNVRNQSISLETSKFVSEEEYRHLTKNASIEVGDVLYTAVGSYGNAAVVDTREKFVFQRHIAHLKPVQDKVVPFYLSMALESPLVAAQANKLARGVAQKTVTLDSLKKFQVPLPPIQMQQEFVARAKNIREITARMRTVQLRHDQLFSSLQYRAFSGQL